MVGKVRWEGGVYLEYVMLEESGWGEGIVALYCDILAACSNCY